MAFPFLLLHLQGREYFSERITGDLDECFFGLRRHGCNGGEVKEKAFSLEDSGAGEP